MEGFTYTDIFDTKGIEYIIIIVFLLLFIPFWQLLNKPIKPKYKFSDINDYFSEKTLNMLKGLFYGKNHTWTHLEKSGIARVGLDDLLLHMVGRIELENMKNPGEFIRKGELLTLIKQGDKVMEIYSPISGEIKSLNNFVKDNPEALNTDPYGQGWLAKIEPSNWIAETREFFLAGEAVDWSKKEMARFKDFLIRASNKYSAHSTELIMQEGGELRNYPLSDMDKKVWKDFEEEFLKGD